jgi:beta-glucosidase-like glycosyl hydrolase
MGWSSAIGKPTDQRSCNANMDDLPTWTHRFGTFSTAEALVSGMDLEMPGPSLFRGQALRRALIGGKIDESHIDVAVRRVSTATL